MTRALLVVDVQNEYFTGKHPITYPPGSLKNILRATDAVANQGNPLILVQHTSPQESSVTFKKGSDEWKLHPEVASRHYDRLAEKSLPGSFMGAGLGSSLRGADVDTVTVAGYMTQMCCDTTARQALHHGFSVEFLSDATGTLDIANKAGKVAYEELHRAVLVTQGMKFSNVIRTEYWINSIEV